MNYSNLGGTFVSESGARGDTVHASTTFLPDVVDEERRVSGKDPLLHRRLSKQIRRSEYSVSEHNPRTGRSTYRPDAAVWPLNCRFIESDDVASGILDPEQLMIAREIGLEE